VEPWGPGSPSFLSNGYRGTLHGRKADPSLPSSAEVKNAWSYIPLPQHVITVRYLLKRRNDFTFTVYLLPVAMDESTDVSDTVQLAVFFHGIVM